MRQIAILKDCTQEEKECILSAVQPEDRVFFFRNEQEFLRCNEALQADIIFGEPDLETVQAMKHLRWIQMSWAGANKYTSVPDFPSQITVTSASGAFGKIISEHILAGILSLYKNLRAYRSQLQQGAWQLLDTDETLEGKRALILGTGNIGCETAKRLKDFDAYTVGISRTQKDNPPYFDESYTSEQLDAQLQAADLVVIALPGTGKTRGMFHAERFQNMKPGALFINVGRGFVADTDALTEALNSGHLRGAVLDVTDPEPLPPHHPLRHMENVILTPHVSGISWGTNRFTRNRILDIFRENLQRDAEGSPLRNIIDFKQGY